MPPLALALRTLFAALPLVLLGGCQSDEPRLYPVRGRVVFADGTAVQGGTVEFKSVDSGTSAIGVINLDGTFRLMTKVEGDGAVAGEHKVVVIQGAAPIISSRAHSHGRLVPARYASYETSGLVATVQAGTNDDLRIVID